ARRRYPSRRSRTTRVLGREALRPPAAVGPEQEVLAVVQAVGAALPQLDGVGPQAVAAPVVRPRDVAREPPVHLPHSLLELLAVPDHRALGRRPRAELGAARAGGEVGVRLLGGQPLDRALEPGGAVERLP